MIHLDLPRRTGPAPAVHRGLPHTQLDQISPLGIQEQLWSRMTSLPNVRAGRSEIAVPDARALHLGPTAHRGPARAFSPDGTEFAHLHGPADGSLHLNLPEAEAAAVISQRWGEFHPMVLWGQHPPVMVMVYGPRDQEELEIVWRIVQASYRFASGEAAAEDQAVA
jgi:Family of unknown function (DUF5519)